MLGLLRSDGPATATVLAGRLGLNTGATSYHLRQLAQHGFIEEDTERGNARDRWWRATHEATYTSFSGEDITDDVEAYLATVAMIYGERLRTVVSELRFYPEQWQGVSRLSDWHFTLTPARAKALVEALTSTVEEVEDSTEDGAAPFVVNLNAYLEPGRLDLREPE
ncbi:MAG: helix-turn-helix domain-containing protein [Actinobacteria bacterium]|nr:helix-turn-helix domain-containing protein [Actinomycetota bacterium]